MDQPSSLKLDGPSQKKSLKPEAKVLGDLLKVRQIIKLDSTEVLLGSVRQIERIGAYYFVLDDLQNQVIRFDLAGKFINSMGRLGQGPGEFESATQLLKVDEDLGIVDASGAMIHIFQLDGTFLRRLSFMGDLNIGSARNLFFDQDRVYVASAGRAAPSSAHLVLNREGETYTKAFGFGERFEHAYKAPLTMVHTYFGRFGDAIWSISPFNSMIQVYDLEGRLMHQLRPGFDGIVLEDSAIAKDDSSFIAMAQQKGFFYKAIASDSLLFAFASKLGPGPPVSVFDKHGQRVATVRGGSFLYDQICGFDQNLFLAAVNLNEFSKKAFETQVKSDDLATMIHQGFDVDAFKQDDATWIITFETR